MLQFRQMGGALARQVPGAGARATLPGEISMFTLGVVPDEAAYDEVRAAVTDVETALAPHRAGEYPNFVEKPVDASRFFTAETWKRLRNVKTRYDAGDLFAGNHHIAPAEATSRSPTRNSPASAFRRGSRRWSGNARRAAPRAAAGYRTAEEAPAVPRSGSPSGPCSTSL